MSIFLYRYTYNRFCKNMIKIQTNNHEWSKEDILSDKSSLFLNKQTQCI